MTDALLPATGSSGSHIGLNATDKDDKAVALLRLRSRLQVYALPIGVPEAMKLLFLRIIL